MQNEAEQQIKHAVANRNPDPNRGRELDQSMARSELLPLVYDHVDFTMRIKRAVAASAHFEKVSKASAKALADERAKEMREYLVKLDKHIIDLIRADEDEHG